MGIIIFPQSILMTPSNPELDSALNTFRELLRQSWIRRAIRGLSMEHPADIMRLLSPNSTLMYASITLLHLMPFAVPTISVRSVRWRSKGSTRTGRRIFCVPSPIVLKKHALLHSSQSGASDPPIGSRAVHMDRNREKLSFLRWLRRLFRGWLRRPWV